MQVMSWKVIFVKCFRTPPYDLRFTHEKKRKIESFDKASFVFVLENVCGVLHWKSIIFQDLLAMSETSFFVKQLTVFLVLCIYSFCWDKNIGYFYQRAFQIYLQNL